MKKILIIILLLNSLSILGQSSRKVEKKLKRVHSIEQFEEFKNTYSNWNINLLEIDTNEQNLNDTLKRLKEDKTVTITEKTGTYTYKLIERKMKVEFRVSYIYLNGNKLSKEEIDSIRITVVDKYKKGDKFSELADTYSMDRHFEGGDLGWFKEGRMVKEFEDAIRNHNKGEIFIVDVEKNKWYFVTLKTYENREKCELKLIKIKINS